MARSPTLEMTHSECLERAHACEERAHFASAEVAVTLRLIGRQWRLLAESMRPQPERQPQRFEVVRLN